MSTDQDLSARPKRGLEVVRPQVAGIDIGARYMYVCGPKPAEGEWEIRRYATTTEEIQACGHWLKQQRVESVAMESTGVYWIPVMEILEEWMAEIVLVDTRPLSRVPGRKTDVLDCQWIQKLHSCGLLQGCFRPSEEIVQLRTLHRQKAVLVAEQSDWVRRMHKCLDQMNVRVHHAVSDTQGTTGMAIIRAIVGGERDAAKLAQLRDPRCQKSEEQIAAFLNGHWRSDHLFNLKHGLKMYDGIGEHIAAYEDEIQQRMRQLSPPDSESRTAAPLPNRERMKALKRRHQEARRQSLYRMVGVDLLRIDGIGVETAETVVSEYGVALHQFENERQFVAHLQLAPRQHSSGGKVVKQRRGKTTGTRTGQALRMAATTLRNSRTALGAYYRRISRTKGAGVAVFATARKLATLLFRMLRWGQDYVDEGQQAYEERFKQARLRSLTATAAQFGYKLTPQTLAVTN